MSKNNNGSSKFGLRAVFLITFERTIWPPTSISTFGDTTLESWNFLMLRTPQHTTFKTRSRTQLTLASSRNVLRYAHCIPALILGIFLSVDISCHKMLTIIPEEDRIRRGQIANMNFITASSFLNICTRTHIQIKFLLTYRHSSQITKNCTSTLADPEGHGPQMFDAIFCSAKKHILGQNGQLLRLCKMQKKTISFRGASPLTPEQGLRPQTAVISSRSTLTPCRPNSDRFVILSKWIASAYK